MVGEINGRFVVAPATVDDPEFGRSTATPTVLRIVVDHRDAMPANVGRLVKQRFFADYPVFSINISFSCGRGGFFAPGVYGDPHSIWFNVFFGYYQIDAPQAQWHRPFGYRLHGDRLAVDFADIVRVGKADWNYFSSYVYGVPEEAIRPHDTIDLGQVVTRDHGRVRIGARYWDFVEVDNVIVASPYLASRDGKRLLNNDTICSPLWRIAFGQPHPRSDYARSFFPTSMRAKFYMSYEAGEDRVYRTLVFGGTANNLYPHKRDNERFLELQLAALRRVIEQQHSNLGFREASARSTPRRGRA